MHTVRLGTEGSFGANQSMSLIFLWKALQSLNHFGARGFQTSDLILLVVCANVDVIATATRHTLWPHVGVPVHHPKDEVVDMQGLWL